MKKVYIREVVLLCLLTGVSIGIAINCAGIFIAPVAADLGIMQGSFAMTSTIATVICAFFSFAIPTLLYTFPVKHMVIVGGSLIAGAMALTGLCSQLWAFYALSVVKGLGMGLVCNTVITTIISNWFYEKSSLITSIVMSFSGLFGALLSPVIATCIGSFGWRVSHFILAGLCVFFLLPCILLPFRAFPLDMDVMPYGFKDEEEKSDAAESTPVKLKYNSGLFLAIILLACLCTSITSIGQYLSGYGQFSGLSLQSASMLLSFAMAGNIISKLVIGVLASKAGPIGSTLIMALTNAGALMLLMFCPVLNVTWIYSLAAFLFGSIYSLSAVSTSMLTRHFYGPTLYVKVFAFVGFAVSVSGAASLPVIGYLYDFTGSYQLVFISGIVLNLLFCGAVLYAAAAAKANAKERYLRHHPNIA